MMLIISPISTAFDRFQLREFLLPIAQHMRLDATQFAHFTDCKVTLCRNRRRSAAKRCAFHAGFFQPLPLIFDSRGRSLPDARLLESLHQSWGYGRGAAVYRVIGN